MVGTSCCINSSRSSGRECYLCVSSGTRVIDRGDRVATMQESTTVGIDLLFDRVTVKLIVTILLKSTWILYHQWNSETTAFFSFVLLLFSFKFKHMIYIHYVS